MSTQKWCNVPRCKKFIFATLNDFVEYGWNAFQIPNNRGKPQCYCPKHTEEMKKDMKKWLLELQGITPKSRTKVRL